MPPCFVIRPAWDLHFIINSVLAELLDLANGDQLAAMEMLHPEVKIKEGEKTKQSSHPD